MSRLARSTSRRPVNAFFDVLERAADKREPGYRRCDRGSSYLRRAIRLEQASSFPNPREEFLDHELDPEFKEAVIAAWLCARDRKYMMESLRRIAPLDDRYKPRGYSPAPLPNECILSPSDNSWSWRRPAGEHDALSHAGDRLCRHTRCNSSVGARRSWMTAPRGCRQTFLC